jgi:flagellar hook-associated protein FlgK
MQKSQQEMHRSANDIARVNIDPAAQSPGADPTTGAGQTQSSNQKVEASQDVIEPLINLKRQEQLFNASAQIVKTADQTLGSLLDVKA